MASAMVVDVRFLGVDLGWVNGASGLAALEFREGALRLVSLELGVDHAEALRWVEAQAGGGDAVVAVDAPTIIRNATGQRPGERLLNAEFRKYGLGCHPANLGRPFAAKTNAFAAALEGMGFAQAPRIEARCEGRHQIEVFPHAAIVRLFGLDYRLKYKKGTVGERVVQLRRLRGFLFDLERADPPCLVEDMLPEVPDDGAARKGVEDRLDAVICAYTAAHYWWWGMDRNRVFGDGGSGFLVVPGK